MLKYIITILRHKWYVFLACRKVGGVSVWQMMVHDLSKFTLSEYIPYRDRVLNGGDVKDMRAWGYAWLHHQNHNPHHWEYWKFFWHGKDHSYDGIVEHNCLPIPEKYIREMIADWMGASRLYTGSWDISDWIKDNLPKMQLHPATKKRVIELLDDLGYLKG